MQKPISTVTPRNRFSNCTSRRSFEFDPAVSATNPKEARRCLPQAITVFDDPLGSTLPDDQHSEDEERHIIVGSSEKHRLSSSFTLKPPLVSASSEPASPPRPRGNNTKKSLDPLAPRPNLDFSKGVRGKYYERMQQGTNLVVLDPALMDHFPDSESVNRALHAFLAIGDSVHSATKPRRRPKSAAATFDPRTGAAAKVSVAG